MAPLAYIAGWADLRDDILDDALRIEDPKAFAAAARRSGTTTPGEEGTLVKAADYPHFKKQIEETLDSINLHAGDYELEARRKATHSLADKAKRKGSEPMADRRQPRFPSCHQAISDRRPCRYGT